MPKHVRHNERVPSLVVIGGGKMGEAIVAGWLDSDSEPADELRESNTTIVEPSEDRRAHLEQQYLVRCVADLSGVERADIVVLAVKPQVMMDVLSELSEQDVFKDDARSPLFISIAAGIATSRLETALPEGAAVVRVMPNMPLQVGAGASAVCKGANATDDQAQYVAELFGCLGCAVVVDESEMDAVCALSGSGPAYVAAMIEAMRDSAVDQGLDAELAETLALQTVLGTAALIYSSDMSVQEVREAVCSPGGTTLAALEAMNAAGFAHVFDAGIVAAVKRSKELAAS